MALGHGLQDAQKTMGVIVLALDVGGFHHRLRRPVVGDPVGRRAVGRHLRRRLADHAHARPADHRPRPAAGFAAETTASAVLYTTAFVRRADLDDADDHVVDPGGRRDEAAVLAVRWGVAGNIVVAWVLTIPMAALVAALAFWLIHPLVT